MYIAKNKVRMHDTDMAGIVYFPRQFRFMHDTFEDMMEEEGITYEVLFNQNNFVFVIVHAESDYLAPLSVGDDLIVHLTTEKIGTHSFTMHYDIFKNDNVLVGRGQTVHVTLDNETRTKIPVPEILKRSLAKHLK